MHQLNIEATFQEIVELKQGKRRKAFGKKNQEKLLDRRIKKSFCFKRIKKAFSQEKSFSTPCSFDHSLLFQEKKTYRCQNTHFHRSKNNKEQHKTLRPMP